MLSTIGIAVSGFYCCSKLKSVNFSFNSTGIGNFKKDAKEDGCCKTTHQYLKVNDTHVASNQVSFKEKHFSILHTGFPSFEAFTPRIQQQVVTNNINAPPLISGTPVYIFNCTYRI